MGGCASASHQVFDRIADRFQHLFSSSSDRAGPRHEQSDVVGQYRLSGSVRSWQALMLHDDWLLQVWRPGLPSQSQTDSHPKAAILLCVNIAATCATPRFTFRTRRKNWRALCSAVGPAGHMKLVRLAAGSVSASSSHRDVASTSGNPEGASLLPTAHVACERVLTVVRCSLFV